MDCDLFVFLNNLFIFFLLAILLTPTTPLARHSPSPCDVNGAYLTADIDKSTSLSRL